jgi:hypothetical protein
MTAYIFIVFGSRLFLTSQVTISKCFSDLFSRALLKNFSSDFSAGITKSEAIISVDSELELRKNEGKAI